MNQIPKELFGEVERLAKEAFAAQGSRAFENTKRATAFHEAGHAVIAILNGHTVRRVWIKRTRVNGAENWIGRTHDRIRHGTSPDSPVEADIELARSEIAGLLAETMFDGRDFRFGSSLDEIARFKLFVQNISRKTGAPFEDVAGRIIMAVSDALNHHRPEVEAIAAALMARGELKAGALMKVFERARRRS